MSTSDNDKRSDPGRDRNSGTSKNHSSGMRPSIITTINNTSPTPIENHSHANSIINSNNNNNNGNLNSRETRTNEPFYESYIEDSFVGHWETEDDDEIDPRIRRHSGAGDSNSAEDDDHGLHPSTIEFDFDSFGPESFIYQPTGNKPLTDNVAVLEPIKEVPAQVSIDQELEAQTEKLKEVPQALPDPPHIPLTRTVRPPRLHPTDNIVDMSQIDLRVIEPYKRVISHAGYCHPSDPSIPPPIAGDPTPAVIVFSACYLPDRSRHDYSYVMDHLFLYVLSSLHELIADDYILIYLHNTQPPSSSSSASSRVTSNNTASSSNIDNRSANNLPTFTWMKRCYQMIDRKLRKNLKILYLVKPTFWLKTVVIMCKPFISTKFSKKLRFIEDMETLKRYLPVDQLILPASAENI